MLAYRLVALVTWAFARMLTAALSAGLWVAGELGSGADGWTIGMTIARAVARAASTPQASLVLIALAAASALALFGLQRLLGSETDQDSTEKDQNP